MVTQDLDQVGVERHWACVALGTVLRDLVGNVWEWCATESTRGRYMLKGSAWTSPLFRGVPAEFNDANNFMQDDDTGFRCVAVDGLSGSL